MRYAKLVFAMTLLVAVLAFVAGNTTPITLRFLVWETPAVSLSLVVAGFFLLGILFTLLIGLLMRMRRGANARTQARESRAPAAAADPQAEPPEIEPTSPGKEQNDR